MAALAWSCRAEADLESIHRHISEDPARAADELADRIVRSVLRLTDFPLSGRVVPEFQREDIREIIVGNYRVVYWLREDIVGIALVRHGARLMPDTPSARL